MIPTLIGVTLVVFAITRFLPGGPVEQAIMQGQMADGGSGTGLTTSSSGVGLTPGQLEQIEAYYGFDRPWLLAYFEWLGRVLRGDLGDSYRYQTPVTEMIFERVPISVYYGLITFVLTYAVCIPLGILKTIKHRSKLDNVTSVVVFGGYAVPGYALGAILLVYFGFDLEWFPTGGFVSADFPDLSFWGQVGDLAKHSVLPLACYMVGSFAFLTLLMKNSLFDNLAADYMRTATEKGLPFGKGVFRHALRNSLIPIATNFGNAISIFVAGSFLIEKIFSIEGMGLLGYTSLIERDYPVVMGILLISSILLLIGNILSDMLVAAVDPRIRFD